MSAAEIVCHGHKILADAARASAHARPRTLVLEQVVVFWLYLLALVLYPLSLVL